jgi:hypothetical protein
MQNNQKQHTAFSITFFSDISTSQEATIFVGFFINTAYWFIHFVATTINFLTQNIDATYWSSHYPEFFKNKNDNFHKKNFYGNIFPYWWD